MNKLRRMVRFVTPYKWRLGFFLFTAVGFSASNSLPFLIMKRFLDIILDRESPAEQMWSPFWRAVTVLALLLLVRVYFVIRREVAQMYLSQVAVRDATDRVTAHVSSTGRWRSTAGAPVSSYRAYPSTRPPWRKRSRSSQRSFANR